MTDWLRNHLQKRAENWNRVGIPPSKKKSDALRKRLNRGVSEIVVTPTDCRDCPKHPCGQTLHECDEPSRTLRCKICGTRVTFRFVMGVPWEMCPSCSVNKEMIKNDQ